MSSDTAQREPLAYIGFAMSLFAFATVACFQGVAITLYDLPFNEGVIIGNLVLLGLCMLQGFNDMRSELVRARQAAIKHQIATALSARSRKPRPPARKTVTVSVAGGSPAPVPAQQSPLTLPLTEWPSEKLIALMQQPSTTMDEVKLALKVLRDRDEAASRASRPTSADGLKK